LKAIPFLPVRNSVDKQLCRSIHNLFGFFPIQITLYKIALSHRAAPQKYFPGQNINNERLEYLGDAVLSSIVADYLYKKFPYKGEGFLTEMRSRLVSRSRLNRLALKMGFDKLIFEDSEMRTLSKSIFGDTFEAMIGAIYLDKGYRFTRKIMLRRIIDVHLDIEEIEKTETNFKSRIIEFAQREKKAIEFKVTGEVGEGYKKQYIVELFIEKEAISHGQDYSIKGAEQVASERACEKLFEGEDPL
jgi:ribonuclease-3